MEKHNEMALDRSCWNKALPHEQVFVLMGRDLAASAAIGAWIKARIEFGLNKPDDEQIRKAKKCMLDMQAQHHMIHLDLVDRNGRPD